MRYGGPFLGPERDDGDNESISTVAITPPELDIGSFAVAVVLCLVKSKGHRSPRKLEGRPTVADERPPPCDPHSTPMRAKPRRADFAMINPARKVSLCQDFA